jgi:hypothetical protein
MPARDRYPINAELARPLRVNAKSLAASVGDAAITSPEALGASWVSARRPAISAASPSQADTPTIEGPQNRGIGK